MGNYRLEVGFGASYYYYLIYVRFWLRRGF